MAEHGVVRGIKLFAPGPGSGTAVLNFKGSAHNPFDLYGHAFHAAGRTLVDRLLSGNGYSDLDAFPILYLYRHALELYLKAIVLIGREIGQLHGNEWKVAANPLRQHRLSLWMPEVKRTFEAVGWRWELDTEGIQTFTEVETLVRELEDADPGSDTFRYPVDTNGADSLPLDFQVHIPTFCTRLDALLDILDAATMGLRVMLDELKDETWEMQSEDGR